jgi:hypothetical protein
MAGGFRLPVSQKYTAPFVVPNSRAKLSWLNPWACRH